MEKVYSYIITKNGEKLSRVVSGSLVRYIELDYKNATLEELQQAAYFALKQSASMENGVKCDDLDDLMLYRGGNHIRLVHIDDMRDPQLFFVGDSPLDAYPLNGKDIYFK